MGTTQTALQSTNPHLGFVLCIGGYKYLLTDGLPTDATTAWSGTLWSDALPGLEVHGFPTQEIRPWSAELNVPRLSFRVVPDSTDRFAIDMFKSKPTASSELTGAFAADADGGSGFTMTIKSDTNFASSGLVYVGNEAFNYGSITAGDLDIAADGAGYYAPFGDNTSGTNRFPGAHGLPTADNVASFDTHTAVKVTDHPATWIGRKVGLYVHRIEAGVWDTKAQAELWFAGVIDRVSEDASGATVVECDGIQRLIEDAIILQDQWTGRVKEGYNFVTGDYVRVWYQKLHDYTAFSAKFVVGTDITAGYATATEFAALLAQLMDEDSVIGLNAGLAESTNDIRWSAYVGQDDSGWQFKISAVNSTAVDAQILIETNQYSILDFLGFQNIKRMAGSGWITVAAPVLADATTTLISDKAPYKYMPISAAATRKDINPLEVAFDETDGTFLDHTSDLPPAAAAYVSSGETWSFYESDGVFFLGKRVSDTSLTEIYTDMELLSSINGEDEIEAVGGARYGDKAKGNIRQILFLSGSFTDIVLKLLSSGDGTGTNHATYDVYNTGANIPFSLMGSMKNSLENLEQSGIDNSIVLVVEKPGSLWDLIKSDFALRMANIIWKDGGLQAIQLSIPNPLTADFALDETNKSDSSRTSTAHTSEFLCNNLKIEFNRNPATDKYDPPYIVRDLTSIESLGLSRAKTIKARNTYGASAESGASAEALAQMITARFMPIFAKPVRIWTRSINHRMFHMAPGDSVSVSDDFVRDPTTGQRGVTLRAGIVLSVSHSFGISTGGQGYFGECSIMFSDEERSFPLAPSGDIDKESGTSVINGETFVEGWAEGAGGAGTGGVILLAAHRYSGASDPTDVNSFAAGDEVRVTEISPSDPASADAFTDTVVSVDTANDEVELTTGFGGANPTHDTAKFYRIDFASYADCQASQRGVTFQADDADGLIQNLIEPNVIGEDMPILGFLAADATRKPPRYAAEQYGDGVPLSAGTVRDLSRMANNLAQYKTTNRAAWIWPAGEIISGATSPDFRCVWTFFYYMGELRNSGAGSRLLSIAPIMRSSTASTLATMRITTSEAPPIGSYTNCTFVGPKTQLTFTTTSNTSWSFIAAQTVKPLRALFDPAGTFVTIEIDEWAVLRGIHKMDMVPA